MSSSNRLSSVSGVCAALICVPAFLVAACSHDQKPPAEPVAQVSAPPMAQAPQQDNTFVVSETIRTKCNLPEARSDSPQFDFDDTALRPRGMGILDGIATCMREGSLKGQGIVVIGHTDPRGSDAYNNELGMRRATAARDYLTSKGVADGSVTVKSHGEQDATGSAAPAWQLDRRVEIDERSADAR